MNQEKKVGFHRGSDHPNRKIRGGSAKKISRPKKLGSVTFLEGLNMGRLEDF